MSASLTVLAVLATVVATAFLPQALWTGRRSGRTVLLIMLLELHFVGQLVLIAEPGEDPMQWFRVPRTLACSTLAVVYVILVARDRRRFRAIHRMDREEHFNIGPGVGSRA